MTDMDDSPDKARRNLLLISTAVIAYAYLRPQFQQDAKLFGIISLKTIDTPKLLVIAMILLGYFVLRFCRSPHWQSAFEEWRAIRASRWKDVVAKHFDPAVLAYLRGEEPNSTATGLFVLSHHASGPILNKESLKTLKLHRTLEWRSDHCSHGTLVVQADYLYFHRAERQSHDFEVFVHHEQFRWKQRWNTIWSQITSNLAIEVHLPLGLATIAAINVGVGFVQTCKTYFFACVL